MNWNRFLTAAALGVFGIVGWLTWRDLRVFRQTEAGSFAFLPGHLSNAHAFLENQCTACHTPGKGVSQVGCVSCHANNTALLQRQSTAFHANVISCKECHREHQGGDKPPLLMDHIALAKVGVWAHAKVAKDRNQIVETYFRKVHADETAKKIVPLNSKEHPITSTLNCISCHATRDKHQGLFGTSCLSCHTTQSWRIAEYKHPSPNSRSCAQCHQAPPSHYMMHFEMVSQKVAGKEHAKVNQCFLCHQTTSWNDIKGRGWYKHH